MSTITTNGFISTFTDQLHRLSFNDSFFRASVVFIDFIIIPHGRNQGRAVVRGHAPLLVASSSKKSFNNASRNDCRHEFLHIYFSTDSFRMSSKNSFKNLPKEFLTSSLTGFIVELLQESLQ